MWNLQPTVHGSSFDYYVMNHIVYTLVEPPPCSRFSLAHEIFMGTRDWDFQCRALKERYQHESFCNRYYECGEDDAGNWVIQVHSCPLGRIFDEAGRRCVDGSCPTG